MKPVTLVTAILLMTGVAGQSFAQSKVIAKVGDAEITEQELTFATADLGEQFAKIPEDKRRGAILSALIDIKLLAEKAREAGTDQEQLFQSQMAFVKSRALHNLYFQKNIVEQISDEEVKARFDKEIAAMTPAKQIRARHILLKGEDEARAVIAELDGGADFVELAKEKSTGPSGPNGGDLDYFGKGQMVPEFEAAAFALENGQYTKEPVKTQFGFHVIKKEDERDEPLPTFESAKDQVRQIVMREKYFDTVQKAREAIKVEITDEALKAEVEAVKAQ